MSEQPHLNSPSATEKPMPPIPESTAEGIVLPHSEGMDEEKRRLFEETLRSLDANISEEDMLKGRITYAQMFSELPPEMQATIVRYFTKRDTIVSAIIGGRNRLLQNKRAGITEVPTLPVTSTIWKRPKARLPLPPESDFKKRAASDPS